MLCRTLLFLSAAVILAGLISRWQGSGARLRQAAARLPQTGWDETVQSREVTLPQQIWYALQTGSFSTQAAAKRETETRGGIVLQDGTLYRVLIAAYDLQPEAAAVRDRLKTEQQLETYLYTWRCPEVALRLTGMAGQLDVVEAGLTLAAQHALRLRDAAVRVENGAMTAQAALAMIDEMDEQMTLWLATARERFEQPCPEVVGRLMEIGEAWRGMASSLRQAQGAALAERMQQQALRLYGLTVQLRSMLTAM